MEVLNMPAIRNRVSTCHTFSAREIFTGLPRSSHGCFVDSLAIVKDYLQQFPDLEQHSDLDEIAVGFKVIGTLREKHRTFLRLSEFLELDNFGVLKKAGYLTGLFSVNGDKLAIKDSEMVIQGWLSMYNLEMYQVPIFIGCRKIIFLPRTLSVEEKFKLSQKLIKIVAPEVAPSAAKIASSINFFGYGNPLRFFNMEQCKEMANELSEATERSSGINFRVVPMI